MLDGRNSSDAGERISGWLWTKISGPASYNIIYPADSITRVKSLGKGIYLFELKVIDNRGLFARDTVQIIVNDLMQLNGPSSCFAENLNWSLAANGMMALINPGAIAGTLDCAGYGAELLIPSHYDVCVQYEGPQDWVHLDYVFRDAIYSTAKNIFLSSTIYNDPTGNDGPASVPVVYANPNSGIDF